MKIITKSSIIILIILKMRICSKKISFYLVEKKNLKKNLKKNPKMI